MPPPPTVDAPALGITPTTLRPDIAATAPPELLQDTPPDFGAYVKDLLTAEYTKRMQAYEDEFLGDLDNFQPRGILAAAEDIPADEEERLVRAFREAHRGLVLAHRPAAFLPVSDDQLMDAGVIPDTRPPTPRPTWRTRARRRWHAWRERTGLQVGSWIAGTPLCDGDHP